MNLIVVDVQPFYHQYCQGVLPETASLIEQAEEVKMFWVGDGLTSDSLEDVVLYWLEAGLSADTIDRIDFIEKSYGWLRPWMDTGVPDDVIVGAVQLMVETCQCSSWDLSKASIKALCYREDGIPGWGIRVPEEQISVPQFSLDKFIGKDWHICGGGRNECLSEVELTLRGYGVKAERLCQAIWP